MKKHVMIFITGLTITMVLGFKGLEYYVRPSTAEVEKVDGLYIFTGCKPVLPYDSLGTVDAGFITGTQYESIRNNIANRANKRFRDADGVILHYDRKGIDKGLVIKFKDN